MKTTRSRAGVVRFALGLTALSTATCTLAPERSVPDERSDPAAPTASRNDAVLAQALVCEMSDGVVSDLAVLDPVASRTVLAADVQPLLDPIPEDPVPTDLALTVEEFAAFPKSDPFPPTTDARLVRQARINFIGDVPDGSGRMYTPDLNGTLYMVEQGTPTAYLDVRGAFPDFFSGRGLGSGLGFVAFHPDFGQHG